MGISSKIQDGKGNGFMARVDDEGALFVSTAPRPPISNASFPLPFAQMFVNDLGSSEMSVDGSATPIDFYIEALQDFDIYINSISVKITDPNAELDQFGAIPELTNGVRWLYFRSDLGEYDINPSIKTNLEFFRDATAGKGFGNKQDAWIADIGGGTGQDTYFPEIDISERFGLVWGLQIPKGTNTRLIFRVQDDLTGVSSFDIKAYGIRI